MLNWLHLHHNKAAPQAAHNFLTVLETESFFFFELFEHRFLTSQID